MSDSVADLNSPQSTVETAKAAGYEEVAEDVAWEDDPSNPINFSMRRKWTICTMNAWLTFCVSFASSVYAPTTIIVATTFHVSDTVTILGISLYVLGYAFGPLLWAPLGDAYGRRLPLRIAMTCFCIFQIPVAVASNVETILVCRFLAGLFGSVMFALAAGISVDILDPERRRLSTILFLGNVFFGPAVGPIAGAFLTGSSLGWRWTAWITIIISGPSVAVACLIIPETYQPELQRRRKRRSRDDDTQPANSSSMGNRTKFDDFVRKYLKIPLHMLLVEPLLAILTVYLSLVYGILYLTLEAFPISFQIERGWSIGIASLPFAGLLLGFVIASVVLIFWPCLAKILRLDKYGPEDQLVPMMFGACLLPVGLFWFSGTSSPSIHPAPQIISTVPIGTGILLVFIPGLGYIIETYLVLANAGLSANSFVRSLLGFAFPLFAPAMYRNLGTPWATRTLAFCTVLLAPFPFVFRFYGRKVRQQSRYAFKYPS